MEINEEINILDKFLYFFYAFPDWNILSERYIKVI